MLPINCDELVKSWKMPFCVLPAEAGIQEYQELLGPGDPIPAKAGSRGDGVEGFLQSHQSWGLVEVDDGQERLRFEAGSTDEGSVNVRV